MTTQSQMKRSNSIMEKEKKEQNLWEKLKIDFQFELKNTPEKKIIIDIDIQPEEASKLIKHFVLETTYNGRKNPVEFDGQCRTVAISNLNSTEDNLVVRVEAIPKNQDFTPEKFKEQTISTQFDDSQLNSLISTQRNNYQWKLLETSKYSLTLTWSPIIIKYPHIYVVCLDDIEIQYIRPPLDYDKYEIYINNFEPGTEHFLEIFARLTNSNKTYSIESRKIIVPRSTTNRQVGNIYLSKQSDQLNGKQDGNAQKTIMNIPTIANQSTNESKGTPRERSSQTNSDTLSCGCSKPHDSFLGTAHYINNDDDDVVFK